MEIIPIASDSAGTRSMATFVRTKDCSILIDPGVALGPSRYRLPPHPLELQKLEEDWTNIKRYAKKADIMAVTHYHYDHHNPNEPEIYRDKITLLKHRKKKINLSQKKRAGFFIEKLRGIPRHIEYSDSREFVFGSTRIKFSDPVFHGTNSRLGYVTEVSIKEIKEGGSTFVFTSDVEGPGTDDQVDFILEENPDILYLDGPLSYMLGYRYSKASLDISVENIIKILKKTRVEKLIIDHHLLRDMKWKERISKVFKEKKTILTAAAFSGLENTMLEARRKELYDKMQQNRTGER